MFLIGIAISVIGIFMSLYFKGLALAYLLNPAAIVLHIFAIVAVLTATQSFKVFWGGLKAAIFPAKPISEELRGRAASLFRLLSKITILASLMGIIIGVMSALSNMADMERFGHAVSSAFVTALLGLILIAAVFEPVVFILKKRQDAERKPKTKD